MANDRPDLQRKMEKDLYLINRVKIKKDEDSLKKLIERHSGIYIDMVNKYIPESLEGVSKQDLLKDKDYCIYDAAIKYDKGKNTKFGTYVGNLARWKCLNIYNKHTKFPQMNISELFGTEASQESEIKNLEYEEEIKNALNIINNIKDKRVKEIFKMRYCCGKKLTPWKKIAKKLDLSIQGCINIHNKHLIEIQKICTVKQ